MNFCDRPTRLRTPGRKRTPSRTQTHTSAHPWWETYAQQPPVPTVSARVVGNVRPAAPRPARLRTPGGKRTPSRTQTRTSAHPWWETYGGRRPNRPRPRKIEHCNLILWIATGWHVVGIKPNAPATRFSAGQWAFPLRPDGGRKDCKVTRVVEMECASRSFPGDCPRRLSRVVLTDESVNLARHPSTHAAITHHRREVEIQA
jgi:hypothetical protein